MSSEEFCYVCFDTCSTRSQCKCNSRFIHDACLIKSIEARGFDGACSVCKAPFANVSITNPIISRRLRAHTKCFLFSVFASIVEASLTCYFHAHMVSADKNRSVYTIGFVMLLIATSVGVLLALKICVRTRRRAEPWIEQWVGSAKIVLVGELCA